MHKNTSLPSCAKHRHIATFQLATIHVTISMYNYLKTRKQSQTANVCGSFCYMEMVTWIVAICRCFAYGGKLDL